MKQHRSLMLTLISFLLLNPATVLAQKAAYPKGPIRMVITHAAGGTTDMAGRVITHSPGPLG